MNYILSSLMIVLALSVTLNSYLNVFIPRTYPRLWSFPEPFLVLIGPLFYLYIKALSGSSESTKRSFFHLLPFSGAGIAFILFISNYSQTVSNVRVFSYGIGLLWIAIYFHFWIYYFLNYKALLLFREKLKKTRSSIESIYQSWITYCLLTLLTCYTVLGILFLIGHHHIFLPINQILAVMLSLIIISIGYRTLTQQEMFVELPTNDIIPSLDSDKKYNKSGLTEDGVKNELNRVQNFMKSERPYLDFNLDLKTLSSMLNLSPHHLSQVINKGTNMNYYDFVNNYRIEEAKNLLSDPKNDHMTILGIAFDVGFNSKATFNRFFKKATHQTPSQFRKNTKR